MPGHDVVRELWEDWEYYEYYEHPKKRQYSEFSYNLGWDRFSSYIMKEKVFDFFFINVLTLIQYGCKIRVSNVRELI